MPGLAASAKASARLHRKAPAKLLRRRVPGIHVFATSSEKDVDGRDKPGHDERRVILRQLE
jgi:hypothetical protein